MAKTRVLNSDTRACRNASILTTLAFRGILKALVDSMSVRFKENAFKL